LLAHHLNIDDGGGIDDDGGMDKDDVDAVDDDDNGKAFVIFYCTQCICYFLLHSSCLFHMVRLIFIGFDLNLPLDEYGAVDFDFVQNHTGKNHAEFFVL
jgi:hypothetical protein